jgi:hypothetical protein
MLASFIMIPTYYAAPNPIIIVDPPHPKPKGVVNFTVTMPDTEIIENDNAVISVEECASGLCFTDKFNESMTKIANDTYQVTIILRHENAVEMKYRFGYLSLNGWIWYPANMSSLISVTLNTNSSDIQDHNDYGSDTPGFEAIGILVALILLSFIFKRCRI